MTRMVEEMKKMMCHFYRTYFFNETSLEEKGEKTILGPVESTPETYHSTCESIYKTAHKKYILRVLVFIETHSKL